MSNKHNGNGKHYKNDSVKKQQFVTEEDIKDMINSSQTKIDNVLNRVNLHDIDH